ncbi:XK-related protein 8-like [Antennarius striatus]|uniref:XK-related protein 8-like n=1 Tax=Antennarius striatus TaxID=241820 RepID=UPI0035AE0B98
MGVFTYSPVDFLLTCMGLVFLLLDIGLDTWAVVTFYQEKAYVGLSFLLLFLLGSSVLVQAFSWLWYSYKGSVRETTVEKCLSMRQLKVFHVLQLGIFIRHAGVVEISVRSFRTASDNVHEDVAVCLNHDLSLLRLIETFSESAPQLVLMLAIILQRGQLDPVTVLKALGSASAIAISITMYHRAMRSFLPDKARQNMMSSAVYFLWNLLLIASRLVALSLFASMLPCFIVSHFFCSWVVLFFLVWQCKTDFMDSSCGEWLYRATVGLFLYFNWFNVVGGRTKCMSLFYHTLVLADIIFLCSLWCWNMINTEHPHFKVSLMSALITAVSVVGVYIIGLLFKIMYYHRFHPNDAKEKLKGSVKPDPTQTHADVVDSAGSKDVLKGTFRIQAPDDQMDHRLFIPPEPHIQYYNKRMRRLAENFYS